MRLEYTDIKQILPHREPFLLVDYADINREDQSCIGYKNIAEHAFFFKGHFPNNPLMPGVIILEAMAQTAGLLSNSNYKQNMYLVKIDQARFKEQVKPNSILEMHVKVKSHKLNFYSFDCTAYVIRDKQKILCTTAIISAMTERI